MFPDICVEKIPCPVALPAFCTSYADPYVRHPVTFGKTVEKELIVYSNNPDYFRRFTDEFRRVQKHCSLYLIVDDPEKFRSRNLSFRQANDEFFFIMGDFVQDGVTYRNIFSMIVDEKESFDVMMIGNTRIGVVTKLPVISYIIRRWLSHLDLLDDEDKDNWNNR